MKFEGVKCDVFETQKDVKGFSITVTDLASGEEEVCEDKDLCPRALERIVKAINRALTPPVKRAQK